MRPSSPRPAATLPRLSPTLVELERRETPAVVTLDDYYRANRGDTIIIPADQGLLANDFSSIDGGAVLAAIPDVPPAFLDFDADGDGNSDLLALPVPARTVTINPDGSIELIIPSNLPVIVQSIQFSYQAFNLLNPLDTPGIGTVFVDLGFRTNPRIAVGVDEGSPPLVNVYDAVTGSFIYTIEAYESSFTGGVRVAVADFTGDGVPDIATAPGSGGGPRIKIFEGRSGRLYFDQFIFESSFTGGAYVASGDVNDDNIPDLIVGAGEGGGPRVLVINGNGLIPFELTASPYVVGPRVNVATNILDVFDPLMDFYAYEDSFRGGVRVAGGDVAGVGYEFVVTAPGDGGGPVVKTFDFNTVVGPVSFLPGGAPNNVTQTRQPLNNVALNNAGSAVAALSFLAGDRSDRNGVNVSSGDTDGDGLAEIITGAAAGVSIVSVFDGRSGGLRSQFGIPLEQLPAANDLPTSTGLIGSVQPPSGTLLGTTTLPASLVPSTMTGVPNELGPILQPPAGTPGTGLPGVATGGVTVTLRDYLGNGSVDIITGSLLNATGRVGVFRPDGTPVDRFLTFPGDVATGINVG